MVGMRGVGGGMLVFMGVLFLLIGLASGSRADEVAVNGVRAQGEVIAHQRSTSTTRGSGRSYFPIVAFRDQTGQQRSFRSKVATPSGRFDIGEEVDVLYLPDNPHRAIIDTFADRHTGHLAGALAMLAILIGITLIRRDRRENAPANPWWEY